MKTSRSFLVLFLFFPGTRIPTLRHPGEKGGGKKNKKKIKIKKSSKGGTQAGSNPTSKKVTPKRLPFKDWLTFRTKKSSNSDSEVSLRCVHPS